MKANQIIMFHVIKELESVSKILAGFRESVESLKSGMEGEDFFKILMAGKRIEETIDILEELVKETENGNLDDVKCQ